MHKIPIPMGRVDRRTDEMLLLGIEKGIAAISMDIMHTNFGFEFRKLNNFGDFLYDERMKLNDSDETVEHFIAEALKKSPYIGEAIRRTPLSQMIAVSRVKRVPASANIRIVYEVGMTLMFIWADIVLRDHYRFSKVWREAFFKLMTWQEYDSSKEKSDTNFRSCFVLWADKKEPYGLEYIRKQFIEEYAYDITSGKHLDKETKNESKAR